MISIISIVLITLALIYWLRLKGNKKIAYIIVLGDLGRSPRMQYHALSLAKAGFKVLFFGYSDSTPHSDVLENKLIQMVHLLPPPETFKKLPSLFSFVFKTIWQSIILFLCLLIHIRPSHVLIQNPPSIPTILISLVICRIRGSRLIIDWHNYGYSIMSLTLKNTRHPLVRIYKWYESIISRLADHHMCVTEAMRQDLMKNWGIRAVTLHDKPASVFKRLSMMEKHEFFQRFEPFSNNNDDNNNNNNNIFTTLGVDGMVQYKHDRPVLIVSSTSWTPDEDFNILFEALDAYNSVALTESSSLPNVVCVVTGKGPLKLHFTQLIHHKNWSKVKVVTPWLTAEDYPKMLGSGDLGVCLHWSSSGLDLPMKVVDMFGCGLPVCAIRYECVNELVDDGRNGWLFQDSKQLSKLLLDLLRGFTGSSRKIDAGRKWLEGHPIGEWDQNWGERVGGLFS